MHLHENAVRLNEELTKLTAETLKENTGWGELMRSAKTSFYEVSDDIYSKQFVNIQKTGIEYPTLIYDGPFSEALDQKLGSLLEGSTVTEQQAMDIALNFIGPDRAVRIEKSSGSSNGILDTWGFQVWVKEEPENPLFISVSKQGGKVVNVIGQRKVEKEVLTIEQAMERAAEFWKRRATRAWRAHTSKPLTAYPPSILHMPRMI